jgi:inosose dehydratase
VKTARGERGEPTKDRRTFTQTLLLGLGVASVSDLPSRALAQKKRTVKIGHTGITWPGGQMGGRARGAPPPGPGGGPAAGGAPVPAATMPAPGSAPLPAPAAAGPRAVNPDAIEAIFRDVSSQGFYGLELFSWQIEGMEASGGLQPFIERYNLPLISSYTNMLLTDPARRKETIDASVNTARIVKKNGGRIIVVGPSPRGANYVFADHKADILATLNEGAKAIADVGLTPVLHQHTGTCIETRDETYAIMEAVDTRYLKFGPDIGQLQKGGSDPVQVVKDFLPIVNHMHMKDYVGGDAFLGYCPLGQGKVNVPAILDMMEGKAIAGMIMVELDSSPNMPMPPLEAAKIAKAYLEKQGVTFRS